MSITRENYEPYFIDLIDGTLPTETVDELLDFLRANPDLAEELKGLEKIRIQPDHSEYFIHKTLIKSEMEKPGVIEETCIRSIENDLSEKDEAEFQHYLSKHPEAANEYRLFQATISEPHPFIDFDKKETLFRRAKIVPFWYAAAAVVLLSLIMWFSIPSQPVVEMVAQSQPIAVENPVVEINTQILKGKFIEINEATVFMQNIHEEKTESVEPTIRHENISEMNPLNSLVYAEKTTAPDLTLAQVSLPVNEQTIAYFPSVPELIAQEVNKIDAQQEVKKFGRFALNKLKDLSDDKLNFETASGGEINKIEYSSRLLAFSIPVNSR